MRIYMIRHGETDYNVRRCYYGHTDARLTENGRRQAALLGEHFRNMTFDRVVVSPLRRAMDTAILAAGHSRDIFEQEERLMEQNFGIFEGKTYAELCRDHPEEMKRWNKDYIHYRIPGGESFFDVRERVEEWIGTLKEEPGQMLVAAHKGTLGHMMAALLHLPPEGYWNFVFDQGCYSCVDLEDGVAIIRKLNQSIVPEA